MAENTPLPSPRLSETNISGELRPRLVSVLTQQCLIDVPDGCRLYEPSVHCWLLSHSLQNTQRRSAGACTNSTNTQLNSSSSYNQPHSTCQYFTVTYTGADNSEQEKKHKNAHIYVHNDKCFRIMIDDTDREFVIFSFKIKIKNRKNLRNF